jgi:DNA repair photolyase
MRRILEVLDAFRHPVGIVTKSALIARDIDILARMAARGQARVALSITTLDRAIARKVEPRAPTPARRLDAIAALARAGVPVGVMVAPVIPGLTDHEIEAILKAARAAGASFAHYALLRLPLEVKDLFEQSLASAFPDRAERVMRLLRDSRGGRLGDRRFHRRMKGTGPYAALIDSRFLSAARRLGYSGEAPALDATAFRPPPRIGDQLSLL